MFWLDIVWHHGGIIHQNREDRKRKSDESRPIILLVLFAWYVGVATGYFCFSNFTKLRTTMEKKPSEINKPSEDTIDVASTSFGNTNKLSNQEIFMLFKENKDAKVTDIVRYYNRLIGLSAVQEHSRLNELTIYKRLKTVYETGAGS